jgi:hypothetical protein
MFTYTALDGESLPEGSPARVFSYELRSGRLNMLAETPPQRVNRLIPAADGRSFCVEYGGYGRQANVMVYLDRPRLQRIVELPSQLESVVFAGAQVFLEVSAVGEENGHRILHYSVGTDRKEFLELRDASRWEFETYQLPVGLRSLPNEVLRFEYRTVGKRLRDGVDYASGIYRFDITTGESKWAGADQRSSDHVASERARDGRFVFFADRYASDWNDPLSGRKLVSSQWDPLESGIEDPKGQRLSELVRFPWPATKVQMSPCGRFVLIRRTEVRSKSKGKVRLTYYAVDLARRSYQRLLRDETKLFSSHAMGDVYWVGDSAASAPGALDR